MSSEKLTTGSAAEACLTDDMFPVPIIIATGNATSAAIGRIGIPMITSLEAAAPRPVAHVACGSESGRLPETHGGVMQETRSTSLMRIKQAARFHAAVREDRRGDVVSRSGPVAPYPVSAPRGVSEILPVVARVCRCQRDCRRLRRLRRAAEPPRRGVHPAFQPADHLRQPG